LNTNNNANILGILIYLGGIYMGSSVLNTHKIKNLSYKYILVKNFVLYKNR